MYKFEVWSRGDLPLLEGEGRGGGSMKGHRHGMRVLGKVAMFSLPGRQAKVKGTRRPKMDTITAPASKLEMRLERHWVQ